MATSRLPAIRPPIPRGAHPATARYITWDGPQSQINELRLDPSKVDPDLVCNRRWTSVTVLWDGRVVPCCFDYEGIMALGSPHAQTLDEIWKGDRLAELRGTQAGGSVGVTLCAKCQGREGYPVRRLVIR